MTDSNDYIGELERSRRRGRYIPGCVTVYAVRDHTFLPIGPECKAAQTRAAWADHFKSMGWAPPEEMEHRENDACPIRFNDRPERQWPTTKPCTIPNIDVLESDPEGYGTYAIRKLCEFARDLAVESERRQKELEELRRDAERWRYVRGQIEQGRFSLQYHEGAFLWGEIQPKHLDLVIDAERDTD